ncbi:efflux RND transporter periplasmic adaptor subunit [Paucibacter sp. KBW04]|uniref:efflux RND transporter periplasmic adaptor subunit n=1 Tax=Paucibacter sp. KBW04 TaxID=2153361 RepID=UPI000F584281|nr:efflux RND transporter periplasmic adaptor subunit [Paucibacter sp. KBW04]RQO56911.1 efflux RND transporter periplasmic adaptor subunit [Paucibacter sp. KBW04]
MRRQPIAVFLTLIALAIAAGWWWKKTEAAAKAAADPSHSTASKAPSKDGRAGAAPVQMVGVVSALQMDVPVTLEASGTVTALKTVDLRAQTTSTIKEVLIKEGQDVRRGDLLFRFDERADRANLDKARAQLARDRATLADLDRQYKRAKDLLAQNFVAQGAVDTALANLEGQRALIQSDEAAVQSAQIALSYNEIRAPMNGRSGIINGVPGSLVQANASTLPLVSITQLDPIAVGFALPETQLAPLLRASSPKDAAKSALQAQVLLPGAKLKPDEPPLLGRVSFVDNLVDSTTGTIKVKAEFENSQHKLWPGQYVQIRMTLRTLKDAVVIPQAAIIQRGNERSVYIVETQGEAKTAQLKPVQIRHVFGEMAAVDGISAGAQVVLDGKQNLRPGGSVKTQAAAVNPAAAAALAKRAASAASASASAAQP